MRNIQLFFIILFALTLHCRAEKFVPTNCNQLSFLPQPQKITCDLKNDKIFFMDNPCSKLYRIKGSTAQKVYSHLVELIEHQQLKTFGCHLSHIAIGKYETYQSNGFKYEVHI